jgi:hypothetical protein
MNRYDEAIEGCNYFLKEIDVKKLNTEALKYYQTCLEVVQILKRKIGK